MVKEVFLAVLGIQYAIGAKPLTHFAALEAEQWSQTDIVIRLTMLVHALENLMQIDAHS